MDENTTTEPLPPERKAEPSLAESLESVFAKARTEREAKKAAQLAADSVPTENIAVLRERATRHAHQAVDECWGCFGDIQQALAERVITPLLSTISRIAAERDELKERLHDAAMARVWTNEDGKKFVFADDIKGPLLGKLDRTRAERDQLHDQIDYWREGYRIATGKTDDELNAQVAVQEATAPHPTPCRWPSSPYCTCDVKDTAIRRD